MGNFRPPADYYGIALKVLNSMLLTLKCNPRSNRDRRLADALSNFINQNKDIK